MGEIAVAFDLTPDFAIAQSHGKDAVAVEGIGRHPLRRCHRLAAAKDVAEKSVAAGRRRRGACHGGARHTRRPCRRNQICLKCRRGRQPKFRTQRLGRAVETVQKGTVIETLQ